MVVAGVFILIFVCIGCFAVGCAMFDPIAGWEFIDVVGLLLIVASIAGATLLGLALLLRWI